MPKNIFSFREFLEKSIPEEERKTIEEQWNILSTASRDDMLVGTNVYELTSQEKIDHEDAMRLKKKQINMWNIVDWHVAKKIVSVISEEKFASEPNKNKLIAYGHK